MRIMQGKKGEGLKGKGTPRVIFQPETSHALRDGISMLAGAIRPTLGPSYGTVAIDYITKEKGRPELLDSGGVIARRIIELEDASEDMGAMLLRAMVCRQHDEIGDGTATATVLFEAIYKAGLQRPATALSPGAVAAAGAWRTGAPDLRHRQYRGLCAHRRIPVA